MTQIAIEALEAARMQILAAYRVWVADDVTAFPPPNSQAGEVLAKIEAAISVDGGREVERDYQAEFEAFAARPQPASTALVERLTKALEEAEETLRLVEQPNFPDPSYHDRVKDLGRQIGFGALMSTASAAWREVLVEKGMAAGGEFVAGPCHGTVVRTLEIVRAALSASQSTSREHQP